MAFGGPFIGYGIQRVLDAQLNFVRNTLPVYLRMRNFQPPSGTLAGQLGFAMSPSGSNVGTTDIEIIPVPAVRMVSIHNIGMSGGKLLFGARTFMLTQTFVQQMLDRFSLPDGMTLWTSALVVGLVTDGKLFSIDDIGHEEMGGQTIVWTITGNANELK